MQLVRPKQVWYAKFPYEDDPTQSKDRPVLVLAVDRENVMVAVMKITSTPPRNSIDFSLQDWSDIPIDHESTLCPTQVRAIKINSLRRLAGEISERDWNEALTRLAAYRKNQSK